MDRIMECAECGELLNGQTCKNCGFNPRGVKVVTCSSCGERVQKDETEQTTTTGPYGVGLKTVRVCGDCHGV